MHSRSNVTYSIQVEVGLQQPEQDRVQGGEGEGGDIISMYLTCWYQSESNMLNCIRISTSLIAPLSVIIGYIIYICYAALYVYCHILEEELST